MNTINMVNGKIDNLDHEGEGFFFFKKKNNDDEASNGNRKLTRSSYTIGSRPLDATTRTHTTTACDISITGMKSNNLIRQAFRRG